MSDYLNAVIRQLQAQVVAQVDEIDRLKQVIMDRDEEIKRLKGGISKINVEISGLNELADRILENV
jgi:cell division protein FtsB